MRLYTTGLLQLSPIKTNDKMKKVFLLFAVIVMVLPLAAQIHFREGSFAQALEATKTENKLVFMDCYTSWCGPCKRMASQVFVQEQVGEYFNPRFVCVKIDMEKGEGVELCKKYDVNAYPTLLVLNAEGELLSRHAGYLEADKLIEFAENGVKGGGLAEMHKRYAAGERSVEFIRDYLAQLDDAAMSGTLHDVADDFLKDKADAVLTDENMYKLFRSYAKPGYAVFRPVYARKTELVKRYGEDAGLHLEKAWESGARKFLKRKARDIVGYDGTGLDAYYALMKECKVPEAEGIRAAVLVYGTIAKKEWSSLLDALVTYSYFSRMVEDDVHYACSSLFYGQNNGQGWENAGERKRFATLLKERIKALKGKKDTSGRTMTIGDKTMPIMEYYCQSYEKMLKGLK